jgi:hypothetical protein
MAQGQGRRNTVLGGAGRSRIISAPEIIGVALPFISNEDNFSMSQFRGLLWERN